MLFFEKVIQIAELNVNVFAICLCWRHTLYIDVFRHKTVFLNSYVKIQQAFDFQRIPNLYKKVETDLALLYKIVHFILRELIASTLLI